VSGIAGVRAGGILHVDAACADIGVVTHAALAARRKIIGRTNAQKLIRTPMK
jgi:hypothetical protein